MSAELRSERRGSTLVLTISDPATGNALSAGIGSAIVEALSVCESDPVLRAVVLTADGKDFCAGAPSPPASGATAPLQQMLQQVMEALRTVPKPVIAAVEGQAFGSGCWLALSCDVLVCSTDALFSAHGAITDHAFHLQALRALNLPRARCLEFAWQTAAMPAPTLADWGLVNRLVPPGTALGHALQRAAALHTVDPEAVTAVKA